MTPDEAREFTRLLGKVAKCRDDLDKATLAALKAVTNTREESTVIWHGGGGFIHLVVGPSMYEVDEEDGDVFLSAEATNGAWSQSVAAQLKFALTPSTFAVMLRRGPRLAGLPGFLRLWLVGGMWGEIGLR